MRATAPKTEFSERENALRIRSSRVGLLLEHMGIGSRAFGRN
jgi:hypothetical protein